MATTCPQYTEGWAPPKTPSVARSWVSLQKPGVYPCDPLKDMSVYIAPELCLKGL